MPLFHTPLLYYLAFIKYNITSRRSVLRTETYSTASIYMQLDKHQKYNHAARQALEI